VEVPPWTIKQIIPKDFRKDDAKETARKFLRSLCRAGVKVNKNLANLLAPMSYIIDTRKMFG